MKWKCIEDKEEKEKWREMKKNEKWKCQCVEKNQRLRRKQREREMAIWRNQTEEEEEENENTWPETELWRWCGTAAAAEISSGAGALDGESGTRLGRWTKAALADISKLAAAFKETCRKRLSKKTSVSERNSVAAEKPLRKRSGSKKGREEEKPRGCCTCEEKDERTTKPHGALKAKKKKTEGYLKWNTVAKKRLKPVWNERCNEEMMWKWKSKMKEINKAKSLINMAMKIWQTKLNNEK